MMIPSDEQRTAELVLLLRNHDGVSVSLGSYFRGVVAAAIAQLASEGITVVETAGEPSAGGWIELRATRD